MKQRIHIPVKVMTESGGFQSADLVLEVEADTWPLAMAYVAVAIERLAAPDTLSAVLAKAGAI